MELHSPALRYLDAYGTDPLHGLQPQGDIHANAFLASNDIYERDDGAVGCD
jgi:hypothetical protein